MLLSLKGSDMVLEREQFLSKSKEAPHPNPLAAAIEKVIDINGTVPFSYYMDAWLNGVKREDGNLISGYYNSSNIVIGDEDGRITLNETDFTTPPENTPVFGFTVAQQILDMWEQLGQPPDFKVVEIGAGTGSLAHDILFALDYFQEKRPQKSRSSNPKESIKYIIIEKSPTLIEKQKERLKSFFPRIDFVRASATEIPLKDITGVIITCELPDTFPVDIVTKTEGGWEELCLTRGVYDKFGKIWGNPSSQVEQFLKEFQPEVKAGQVYPVNLAAARFIQELAGSLKSGYVITVDYDCWRKNSIRISAAQTKDIKGEKEQDVYCYKQNVGQCDLTIGVDFQVLADAGKKAGLNPLGYVTLGGFLFGLYFDRLKSELMREFPNSKIGDRVHDLIRSDSLYNSNTHSVLIQSKGVDRTRLLRGLQFTFNPDIEGGSIEDAKTFRRIKL